MTLLSRNPLIFCLRLSKFLANAFPRTRPVGSCGSEFKILETFSVEALMISSIAAIEFSIVCWKDSSSSTSISLSRFGPVSSLESRMLLSCLDTTQRVTQKLLTRRTVLLAPLLMDFLELLLLCVLKVLLIFELQKQIRLLWVNSR